jgi:hypothetical protein
MQSLDREPMVCTFQKTASWDSLYGVGTITGLVKRGYFGCRKRQNALGLGAIKKVFFRILI